MVVKTLLISLSSKKPWAPKHSFSFCKNQVSNLYGEEKLANKQAVFNDKNGLVII